MAKKLIGGYFDTLDGTCGVALVNDYYFREPGEQPRWMGPFLTLKDRHNPSGCGWTVAGFVNTPESREAYDVLRERYKLIYQSPVRQNANSGRRFFMCLFDSKPGLRSY